MISNILTNQSMVNLAQNTAARVSIETGLKAVGRPGFILADKDLDKETKKYASAKEFLYQAICLGVYLALIPTVFKKGSFAAAKKFIYKDTKGFEKFKNADDFLNFHKLASMEKAERINAVSDTNVIKQYKDRPELLKALEIEDNPANKYYLQKGVIEGGSLAGSILGLAIIAPEVSHRLIHPIMKVLGLEKTEKIKAEATPKLDTKV